jgi:phage shock protein C
MSQPIIHEEQVTPGADLPPGENPRQTSEDGRDSMRRRQLRRSKQDRVIGGVCGGLGRYVDTDPVLFRIAFLALLIPGGAGLLFYILAWIIIPEFKSEQDEYSDALSRPLNRQTAATVVGGLLIVIGSLILIERFIDWFDPRIIGGSALVLIGAFIVWRGLKRGA